MQIVQKAAVYVSVGSTKKVLKILMHPGCPSVDERDQQGFCYLICHFKTQVLLFSCKVFLPV